MRITSRAIAPLPIYKKKGIVEIDHHIIKIFGMYRSNFVRAVRIACEEKQIAYEYYPVQPHSPLVVAIHPLGKVPVMRHGDLTLAEAWPIVAYLDRLYPETPMIKADTIALTAEIEQWVSIVATSIDPVMVRGYIDAYRFPGTPDRAANRAGIEEALPKMERMITMLDSRVAATGFLAASRFTFADALLLSTLIPVRRLPEGAAAIEAAPNLLQYLERHSVRPSFGVTDPPP